ncbi:MAG: cytochrome P450 [Gammaproteobacteria bacterium]|nr:cytochrome P450 [Gammaproteobacteria bacterium]
MSAAFTTTASEPTIVDPYSVPIERLDVSDPRLALDQTWKRYFERMREEAPVHYLKDSKFGPFWSVTRYDDVVAVEDQPQIYSSSWEHGGITILDMQDLGVQLRMFIAMDDPEHAEQRKTVSPALLPGEIKKMAEPMRVRTAEVLDALPVGVPFDWVEHVSVELTTRMLSILLDFPWDERHKLPYWSDWAANIDIGTDPVLNAERERIMHEMAGYFLKLFGERKAAPPKGDLISVMAHSEAMSNLDYQRFLGNIALLVVGGNDTTRNSMSGLVYQINTFPEEWAKLKANSALAANAAVEVVRLQTPIAHMRRTALADTELGGQKIRKGDKVVIWYNAANRDEAVFPDGDRFDVNRENARRHLSFGYGIHRCLGARLAELQLATLIEEMLKRGMEVKYASPPERLSSCFLNAYGRMMVTMTRSV